MHVLNCLVTFLLLTTNTALYMLHGTAVYVCMYVVQYVVQLVAGRERGELSCPGG